MAQYDWNSIILKSKNAAMPKVESFLTEKLTEGANRYIEILSANLPEAISGAADGASVEEPNIYESNLMAGRWFHQANVRVEILLDDEAIQRTSFNGGSVYNIISLFDDGYGDLGNKRPYGTWRGERTVALRSRVGEGFMTRVNAQAMAEIEGLKSIETII